MSCTIEPRLRSETWLRVAYITQLSSLRHSITYRKCFPNHHTRKSCSCVEWSKISNFKYCRSLLSRIVRLLWNVYRFCLHLPLTPCGAASQSGYKRKWDWRCRWLLQFTIDGSRIYQRPMWTVWDFHQQSSVDGTTNVSDGKFCTYIWYNTFLPNHTR